MVEEGILSILCNRQDLCIGSRDYLSLPGYVGSRQRDDCRLSCKSEKNMNIEYVLIDSHLENEKNEKYSAREIYTLWACDSRQCSENSGISRLLLLNQNEYNKLIHSDIPQKECIQLIGISSSTITRFDAKKKIGECRARFPKSIIVPAGIIWQLCGRRIDEHSSTGPRRKRGGR